MIQNLFQVITVNHYIKNEKNKRPCGFSVKEMADKALEFDFGQTIFEDIQHNVTNDAGQPLSSETAELAIIGFK